MRGVVETEHLWDIYDTREWEGHVLMYVWFKE